MCRERSCDCPTGPPTSERASAPLRTAGNTADAGPDPYLVTFDSALQHRLMCLDVMPTEVVDAAGGCVSDGGVVSVEIAVDDSTTVFLAQFAAFGQIEPMHAALPLSSMTQPAWASRLIRHCGQAVALPRRTLCGTSNCETPELLEGRHSPVLTQVTR